MDFKKNGVKIDIRSNTDNFEKTGEIIHDFSLNISGICVNKYDTSKEMLERLKVLKDQMESCIHFLSESKF